MSSFFINIHVPHFLLNLKFSHLLDLCWRHPVLLSRVLVHVHATEWRLGHAHWHLLLWHAHWHLLLEIWLLLTIYVDVNVRINHCEVLVCLVNYILVASRIHHRLLLQIIMSISLLNLRGRCRVRIRFK